MRSVSYTHNDKKVEGEYHQIKFGFNNNIEDDIVRIKLDEDHFMYPAFINFEEKSRTELMQQIKDRLVSLFDTLKDLPKYDTFYIYSYGEALEDSIIQIESGLYFGRFVVIVQPKLIDASPCVPANREHFQKDLLAYYNKEKADSEKIVAAAEKVEENSSNHLVGYPNKK